MQMKEKLHPHVYRKFQVVLQNQRTHSPETDTLNVKIDTSSFLCSINGMSMGENQSLVIEDVPCLWPDTS